MPITKSAKKALRNSANKRAFNEVRKVAYKEAIKDFKKGKGDLADVYQAIDKALKRGILKKNTAARKKSNAAKFVAVAKKGK